MSSHRSPLSKSSLALVVVVVVVLFGLLVARRAESQSRPLGGLEEEKPADDEVRRLVAGLQAEIQAKYPEKFESVEPLAYRTQLVSGVNYFVKALVREKDGDKNYAHLRIYKSFRGPVELANIKTNMQKSHPLQYF